jgi:hypothetical protein
MGGFSGSVPEPTLARVKQLVATGQLRFFLLGAERAGPGGAGPGRAGRGGAGSVAAEIAGWVESSCTAVPGQAYGATPSAAGSGTLYQCRAGS